MDFCEFVAGINDNDRRLDKVLRNFISDTTLSQIYKYLRKNLIKLNDKKASPDIHVFTGDRIKIASFILNQEKQTSLKTKTAHQLQDSVNKKASETIKPDIVFQNQHLLIINKPYDSLVHGSADSLDKLVTDYYKTVKTDSSLSFSPGPLHRLDRKTTGLLSFSFSLEGARWFSENIQTHIIKKEYLGIVCGKLENEERWEDFIQKEDEKKFSKNQFHTVKAASGTDRKYQYSDNNSGNSKGQKTAITTVFPEKSGKYKVNGRIIDITVVRFFIETGRTHQIRAQSSLHGFPLLGDSAYGGEKLNASQDFFLHAQRLLFPEDNPLGLPEEIHAPIPESFSNFITQNC